MNESLVKLLVQSLKLKESNIKNVIQLLDEGNTVPFIARYRKEMTGNMDEEQINTIETEYKYLENLEKRKQEVIRLIDEQGMLDDELKSDILRQTKLNRVEDLYRPFKQKKKTRATEAKRMGLEPLAKFIFSQQSDAVESEATKYLNEEVETTESAISGALDIIAEQMSDSPKYRSYILRVFKVDGVIESKKKRNAVDEQGIFEMYYDYTEKVETIVPHRVLALNRGERENVLTVKITIDESRLVRYIMNQIIRPNSKTRDYLETAVMDGLKRLILPSIEREVRADLSEMSEAHAVNIFKENLTKLLLTPPLKGKVILGVDPAFRTGCKLAVINRDGAFIDKGVIYPHPPQVKVDDAKSTVKKMIKEFDVELIAIGNGTASRETESFISEVINEMDADVPFIIANEAGASVYSASQIARDEFPNLNVEERSAISIARRVQDPLSELVKIDPKSIGVGQYQHDLNQKFLTESLDFVVDTSVNRVGVNVNTASPILLQHVSGLSATISNNIVKEREAKGGFKRRSELASVPRLGKKTFEQSVGFLRVYDGDEPLDVTPIHPENYDVAYKVLDLLGVAANTLGTDEAISKIEIADSKALAEQFDVGMPTMTDILESLKAPLRDIREDFETPLLKTEVRTLEDLKEGMKLTGTVRNVTDFGAFVDIGVKNDGLVHVSQLSNRFVKNPMDIVSVGDIVDVTVIGVDMNKGRVSLSMKK
ncbi:Tex family protein [Aliicoccus persicus]|uniref:LSU ribosomal protein L11P n=1 Tax=Aliicoccus persicus TaxID=930138 RepID=A0A662Z6W3_9STAP|nr:Tex family protein [Aliicoccus persicus]SEW09037.1 LSU ribosomal protein L11P [Aliicoccus persicus]